jgi:hypothetical protein
LKENNLFFWRLLRLAQVGKLDAAGQHENPGVQGQAERNSY